MNRIQKVLALTSFYNPSVKKVETMPDDEVQLVPRVVVEDPGGIVSPDGRTSTRRVFDWLNEYADRTYTDEELRQASTLPMVEMIIETIGRDVTVHTLNATPLPALAGDKWALEMSRDFEQVFAFPYNDLTYRLMVSDIIRDLLVIGKSPIEMLRDTLGASSKYSSVDLLGMFETGQIDGDTFLDAVVQGTDLPGPIVGMMSYAPEHIKERRKPDGSFYPKAFMDLSPWVFPGFGGSAQDLVDQSGAPWWPEQDMLMLRYAAGEKKTFSTSKSPTARMYPLIDVLYTVLYRVKDRLDGRMRDQVLSFEQTKVGSSTTFISPEQITTLVETVKRDIAAGELPVLGGVTAKVSDLGQAKVMSDNMSLLDQFQAILTIGYGAGLVEMGALTETAEGMKEAKKSALKQQVGNMLRIIRNELFGFVWKDPYSIWGSALDLSFKTDLLALDIAERLKLLLEFVKRGLPLGLVLDMEMPQWSAALKARGIDPYSLLDPSVESATIAAGGGAMEGVEAIGA
jgi:hypothetical protein